MNAMLDVLFMLLGKIFLFLSGFAIIITLISIAGIVHGVINNGIAVWSKEKHVLDAGAIPATSTISALSQRARWVVRVSNADTEWFESTSVLLMGVILGSTGQRVTEWTAR